MAFRELDHGIKLASVGLLVSIFSSDLFSEEDESEILLLLFVDDPKIGKAVGDVCVKMIDEHYESSSATGVDEKLFAFATFMIDALKRVQVKESARVKAEKGDEDMEDKTDDQHALISYFESMSDSIEKKFDFMGSHIINHVCQILSANSDDIVTISN